MKLAGKIALGVAGIAVVGGGIGAMAYASNHGFANQDVAQDLMKRYDHDHSGTLELNPRNGLATDERFYSAHLRHGGPATKLDLPVPYAGRLFEAADADHNQVVTGAELLNHIESFDANQDGRINAPMFGSSERDTLRQETVYLEPKVLDYVAPSTNVGVTNY